MIASNYAKALFKIAQEQKKIDTLSLNYDEFKNTISENKDWIKLMDSPMILENKKFEIINNLKFDISFLSFLKMLTKKRLMHFCFDIYEEWMKLVRTHQKIAHIHLVSAEEITEKQEKALRRMLQPRFAGQKLSFHITIDESLIGGIQIVYQGQSLDRSIVRELKELYITI